LEVGILGRWGNWKLGRFEVRKIGEMERKKDLKHFRDLEVHPV